MRSESGFDENLLRIIAMYGERRPRESSLRFGRQGTGSIPDRTLIWLKDVLGMIFSVPPD